MITDVQLLSLLYMICIDWFNYLLQATLSLLVGDNVDINFLKNTSVLFLFWCPYLFS